MRVDADRLAASIEDGCGGLQTARVRTTYHPGAGEWTIEAAEIADPAAGLEPRTLVVRRVAGGLGEHKWVDRRLAGAPDSADDVLLVDELDDVLECGSANVFVVVHGALATPPLDGRILPGTVRARVLALAHADGIERGRATGRPDGARRRRRGVRHQLDPGGAAGRGRAGVGTWDVGPRTGWLRDTLPGAAEPAVCHL